MVYIDISRYAVRAREFDVSKFNTSSSSRRGSSVSNCSGAGTVTSDILEPNDNTSTATSTHSCRFHARVCPYTAPAMWTILKLTQSPALLTMSTSRWSMQMATLTLVGNRRQVLLTGSGTSANVESIQFYASANQTTYVRVYGWISATNTYDIEITTDNPGGGQAFETIDVVLSRPVPPSLSQG